MSASEKGGALELRIEELVGRISSGFPAVSSGADDPMIDGLGALSELDDLLDALSQVVEAAERSVLLYSDPSATSEQNEEIYKRAMAVHDSLAALEKKLGNE